MNSQVLTTRSAMVWPLPITFYAFSAIFLLSPLHSFCFSYTALPTGPPTVHLRASVLFAGSVLPPDMCMDHSLLSFRTPFSSSTYLQASLSHLIQGGVL